MDNTTPVGVWHLSSNGFRLEMTITSQGGGYSGTIKNEGGSLETLSDISWDATGRWFEFRRNGSGYWQWWRACLSYGVLAGRYSHSSSSSTKPALTAYTNHVTGWSPSWLDVNTVPRAWDIVMNGVAQGVLRIDRDVRGALCGRLKVYDDSGLSGLQEELEYDLGAISWDGSNLSFTRGGGDTDGGDGGVSGAPDGGPGHWGGGGGGGRAQGGSSGDGGAGSADAAFDAAHGCGGGGGGSAFGAPTTGGAGALYGGGGGGGTNGGSGSAGAQGLIVVSYTPSGGSLTKAYVTSGSSWTVPANWNSSNNIIECLGGGGGGSNGGGGGGAYSRIANLTLTPGASVACHIGGGGGGAVWPNTAGSGGDTWFNGASLAASSVGAKGGAGGAGNSGGQGGQASAGVGATKYSGGAGGLGQWGSGGGGGAAGPNGAGADGGDGHTAGGGGGGGGSNGGAAGVDGLDLNGGAGGSGGSTRGTGGVVTSKNGQAGASGGGGAGGYGNGSAAGNGGAGAGDGSLDATHGSGSGGGGSGYSGSSTTGGAGGLYGGGGGGGTGGGTGAAGAQGLIAIAYTPAGGKLTTVFLTSGSNWIVPGDWNSASNTIECLGGGGGGSNGGGGGGGYARIANLALSSGASVACHVGGGGGGAVWPNAAGSGGDTWFNGASLAASSVGAKGGAGGDGNSGGQGGQASAGVGAVKFSGGSGAAGNRGSGGGGGAAGANGAGADGGAGTSTNGGGGGGAANGGGAGVTATGSDGGAGGLGEGFSEAFSATASGRFLTGTFTHNNGPSCPCTGTRSQVLGFGLGSRLPDRSDWQAQARLQIRNLTEGMGIGSPPTATVEVEATALPPFPQTYGYERDDDPNAWPQAYTMQRLRFKVSPGSRFDPSNPPPAREFQGYLATPTGQPPSEGFKAVVVVNGHSGSMEQLMSANNVYWYGDSFARRGFVVLALDIGHRLGEYEGVQHPAIVDANYSDSNWEEDGERAFSVRRAIDWLSMQDNVRASRIFLAGLSMGGEVTTITSGLDPRIIMAASAGCSPDMHVMDLHGNHGCYRWNSANIHEYIDFSDYQALSAPRRMVVETGLADWTYSSRAKPFAADKQVVRRASAAYGPDAAELIHYLHYDGHAFHVGDVNPTFPSRPRGVLQSAAPEPRRSGDMSWQTDSATATRSPTLYALINELDGKKVFLTSGSTWTVPSDWDSANNTIECIGGGGGGSNGGGGGGAYAKISNLTLTPGANVAYSVGAGGAGAVWPGAAGNGGDTWFNGGSLAASSVGAKAGSGGSANDGGAGGQTAACVGAKRFAGGSGGYGWYGAGGGGGAGGPFGPGADGGGHAVACNGGAGGGGGNGGAAASNPSDNNGSAGGAGPNGSGGGAGGTSGSPAGGAGASGGGGGGAYGGGAGGAGSSQNVFDSSHGVGSGGGGGGFGSGAAAGGAAGVYGGGGGGGTNGGAGAPGAPGLIVISYSPIGS